MHMLAKHIEEQLEQKVTKTGKTDDYGRHLGYSQLFMAEMGGEIQFIKIINNNGEICEGDLALRAKAEALVHFSHVISEREIMLLDIQGCHQKLYNPEIASKVLVDKDEILFTAGSLSLQAMQLFAANHVCSMYCSMLELGELVAVGAVDASAAVAE